MYKRPNPPRLKLSRQGRTSKDEKTIQEFLSKERKCTKCDTVITRELFYSTHMNKCCHCQNKIDREYRAANKAKHRIGEFKRRYGVDISKEDYIKLVEDSEGICRICGETNKNGKGLSLDHDHKTNKVRDFLCHHCNIGLGSFKDNPYLLEQAIKYLKSYNVEYREEYPCY